MASFSSFKGITNIGHATLTELLSDNIVEYINWGFINAGAFYNIEIPTSGHYGGDKHILRPVQDPYFLNGQVWEAYHDSWVWQSGVNQNYQPISISGIFVDNVFNPVSGGNYYIDYPHGRIVFSSAISINSTVQLEYSHNYIDVIDMDRFPFLTQGQLNSNRVDDTNFLLGSGNWLQLSDQRLQLPAVVVEVPVRRNYSPYQIGGAQYARTQVKLHILSENPKEADRIAEVLSFQNEKTIYMFDTNRLAEEDMFPLTHTGSLAANPLSYPQLVEWSGNGGYRINDGTVQHGLMRIYNGTIENKQKLRKNIYMNTVGWTSEVVLVNI